MASSSFKKMIEERNKYSLERFIEHFKESPSNEFGKDEEKYTVVDHITIDGSEFIKNEFYFLNVIFEGNVTFKDIHFGKGFVFELCEFKGEVKFENCTSSEEQLGGFFLRKASLGITRCKISGNLAIENCTLKNGLLIHGFENEQTSMRSLRLEGGLINGNLSLENSSIEQSVLIIRTEINGYGLRLENVKTGETLRISPNKCKDIIFFGRSSIYRDNVYILGQNLDSLTFNNGEFQGEILLENTSIDKYLSIYGAKFQDSFKISSSESPNLPKSKNLEITIQDSQFENGLTFLGEKCPTKKLNLNFSEKSSGVLDFRNTSFREVHLKGINFNNSVFFRDCFFEEIVFSHFFNKALVSLNNNKPKGKETNAENLLIENSNLGNTEFYDFDFSIYPIVRIIDSRLDSIFVNGVTWFESDQLHIDESETDPKKILSQKREIYRQLKLAAEKQSDRITALEFKAKEVETHRLYLELGNVKKADRWAILAGKTNNHGQDWIKPLWAIIFISFGFFFPLFFIADPEINFWPDVSKAGWNFFWVKLSDHSKIIPQLFNPARRVSDMFDEIQYPFWVYFLDGLHRIVLAFFIFQIVSAFRKFVK
ncbi:hypothetical protein [Algoriphagus sp. CAU 1675]|uniref:hypothetical protein n=1 Tax=Algoriphagus sp. CAU 1675 TaxID=3032597 RepID=UPI0023DA7F9F|nr:hypothetical protein [Algoriphagus sp. CAU 1675]MDF2159387.1 hypothetical protein [Algoriphagus sp. CAU 1675]